MKTIELHSGTTIIFYPGSKTENRVAVKTPNSESMIVANLLPSEVENVIIELFNLLSVPDCYRIASEIVRQTTLNVMRRFG